jgi:hypothetical protein|tara:strand:+ start:1166 stop:1456 length:291 start_codon:yes stop_codon:yes gene_type:complete
MEALRQEIRDEMKTLRVNKKHVYGLLMRLCDEIDGGAPAPVKKAPPPAPVKKAEPAPVKKAEPAPVKKAEPAPAPVKKVVRKTTKKKAEAAEPVLK